MAYYDGHRRRSSAAVAYAPPAGYQTSANPNPNYDPAAPTAPPTSVPYGPPQPAVRPQTRRPSSFQPPPTAPMAIPRHPGMPQGAASYGPSAAGAYGVSPNSSHVPPSQLGSSPHGSGYSGTPPTSYVPPYPPQAQQGYPPPTTNGMPPNSYPPPSNGFQQYQSNLAPPRPQENHSDRLEDHYDDRYNRRESLEDTAVTFDDEVKEAPRHSRTYSYDDPRQRRGSRNSRRSSTRYSDEEDDSSEDDHRRRKSNASKSSKSSHRSSKHKKAQKETRPTLGDSVEWAFKGTKKFFSSERS